MHLSVPLNARKILGGRGGVQLWFIDNDGRSISLFFHLLFIIDIHNIAGTPEPFLYIHCNMN